MAEWPCSGLQIRLPRFDSGFRLHFLNKLHMRKQPDARVVELVDTRDLKSLAGNSVPVQVRPRAPLFKAIWNASIAQLVERNLAKVEVTSSNLVTRSNLNNECSSKPDARVVELVDTRDLKSLAGNSVPVQVRPRAPLLLTA